MAPSGAQGGAVSVCLTVFPFGYRLMTAPNLNLSGSNLQAVLSALSKGFVKRLGLGLGMQISKFTAPPSPSVKFPTFFIEPFLRELIKDLRHT